MKRFFTLFIAAALILPFAACSSGKTESKSENSEAVPETVQSTAAKTQGATEFDSEAAKAELQEQIVGNWTFYNWMLKTTSNHLIFNADGTGSYQGGVVEDGNYEFDYTFTYEISVEKTSEKYTPGIKNTITIRYNEIDESETREFKFYDDGRLNLVNTDNQIIQFDEYTREENIPTS